MRTLPSKRPTYPVAYEIEVIGSVVLLDYFELAIEILGLTLHRCDLLLGQTALAALPALDKLIGGRRGYERFGVGNRMGLRKRSSVNTFNGTCLSRSKSATSGQMPTSKLRLTRILEILTLSARANRSSEAPFLMAFRIILCSWMVAIRLMRLL